MKQLVENQTPNLNLSQTPKVENLWLHHVGQITVQHKASAFGCGNLYRASFVLRPHLLELDLILLPLTSESTGGQGRFLGQESPDSKDWREDVWEAASRLWCKTAEERANQDTAGRRSLAAKWPLKSFVSSMFTAQNASKKLLYYYLANFGTFTFGSKFSFSSEFYLLPTNYLEIKKFLNI